ncbi:hemoglobin subunit beta-B-like [Gouania willdenowi]|uniref:Hemoglobin subunit beta-B-like n=1 Tax=Gouania willdenowi TaxID=441366 RepID=A0A8C5EH08_GOUWI|nr:hemoglobin subunit beta-B-like [Gouania willdenowi]
MVAWSDDERAAITNLWSKIDVNEIGAQALTRLLIVYPWTQRHFAAFGNISTFDAILSNPKVAKHGATLMGGLKIGLKNMDNMKPAYAKLSTMHSEQLHVDPENFRLLGECITICLGAKFGKETFTPKVQEAWAKFVSVAVSALRKQYH